jgi:hypothetical protein
MGGVCSTYGEKRNAYRVWWGNVKEELGTGGDINVSLRQTEWEGVVLIYVVQDWGKRWWAVVNVVMNVRVS